MLRVMEPVDEKHKPGIRSQFKQLGRERMPGMHPTHRCHGDADQWDLVRAAGLSAMSANNILELF